MIILNRLFSTVVLSIALLISFTAESYELPVPDESFNPQNVVVSIEGGVATISGSVDNEFNKASLELAAGNIEGVVRVYSSLTVSE